MEEATVTQRRWTTIAILLAFAAVASCVVKPSRYATEGDYVSEFYIVDTLGRCIHVLATGVVFKIVPAARCQ